MSDGRRSSRDHDCIIIQSVKIKINKTLSNTLNILFCTIKMYKYIIMRMLKII